MNEATFTFKNTWGNSDENHRDVQISPLTFYIFCSPQTWFAKTKKIDLFKTCRSSQGRQ